MHFGALFYDRILIARYKSNHLKLEDILINKKVIENIL